MKIKIAKTAGFCFGVKRAMDIVIGMSNRLRSPIYTDGPLIHNPQIVKVLENRKISVLGDSAPAPDSTVVVRAHGVSPERRRSLEESCAQVVDGTCPLVAKIQNIVQNEVAKGRFVVIVGEAGHPEVIGILGFANVPDSGSPRAVVINSVAEAEALDNISSPVSVVAQSTQELEHFDDIIAALKKKFGGVEVFNTICNATKMRQEEAAELSKEVELMLVVGGKNSGNTKRLAEVCQKAGTRTIFVETENEISRDDIGEARTVGITAGASTPNWMIRNVALRIEEISFEKKNAFLRFIKKIVNVSIDTNLYVAVGTFSMSYVASILISNQFQPFESWLAALYIFSMHTLNRYIDREAGRYNDSRRSSVFENYPNIVVGSGFLASFVVIALSLTRGVWLFLFYVLCSIAGILYSINFVPVEFRPLIRYASLKDIPGSRDLFISAGWAVVLTFAPVVSGKWIFEWRMFYTFSIIFIFAFCRTIILDIKDIQGDSIVGKETIPTLAGSRRSVGLMKFLLLCGVVILIFAVATNEYEFHSLALMANFAYLLFAVNQFGHEGSFYGNYIEGFTDFNFILAGLLILLSKKMLVSI